MCPLLLLLLTQMALAAEPVVAMGDGLVAAPPDAQTAAPSTSSWVAALADCLEERATGRFQVVDRVAPGETVRSARDRVDSVRELTPKVVVLGLGARELGASKPDSKSFKRDLGRLVREIRTVDTPAEVFVVGMIAPTLHQADAGDPEEQTRLDELADAWNDALVAFAKAEGVRHVDLWSSWPRDGGERASLTTGAWELSDQGHARVAAAVCDALVE